MLHPEFWTPNRGTESKKSVYCLALFLYMVWRAVTVSDRLRDLQLQPDPFGAVDEAQRDEGLGLVVGELVRPRHPTGVARARARALVLPVEHRPATAATTRERYFSSKLCRT